MAVGYTTVSSAHLTDASGVVVDNATISFQPCNNLGQPLSFRVNAAGQAMFLPVQALVSAGIFSVPLADTTLTSPLNIGYLVTVIDNVSGKSLLGPGYIIQPSGSAWNFDTFIPNLPALSTITPGPVGPPGPPGVASLVQLAAIRTKLPATPNLFDKTAVTTGMFVVPTTGALSPLVTYVTSDYISANAGASMATATAIGGAATGYAFYDQAFTFISGVTGIVAAGGNFTVPATAAYIRVSILVVNVQAAMIVNGTILPSAYIGFPVPTQKTVNDSVSTATSIVAAKMAGGSNIFDRNNLSVGAIKNVDGSLDPSIATASASNFMLVYGLSFITCNITMAFAASGGVNYSVAFYDQTQVFVSSLGASQVALTPIAIPSNAYYCRFFFTTSTNKAGSIMVVPGSTMPSSYVSYAFSPTSTPEIYATIRGLIQEVSVTNRNMFNVATIVTGSAIQLSNGLPVGSVAAAYYSDYIPVIAGQTYVFGTNTGGSAATLGAAWYDITKAFLLAGPQLPSLAGDMITAPSGAAYLRISGVGVSGNIGLDQMITPGTVSPTVYRPYNITERTISPASGKKLGIWGDSLTQLYVGEWFPTVRARVGVINAFQDAHGGRPFANCFENYTGTIDNPGTNLGSGGPLPNTGTLGNTLAQDLAGLDGMLCWLGTNDATTTIGAHGDPKTAATLYGYVRAFIEAVVAANPAMRLIMITPYSNSSKGQANMLNVTNVIKTVAADYGAPVLDLWSLSGINSFTEATFLMGDHLHITPLGGSQLVGPAVAEFIQRWF